MEIKNKTLVLMIFFVIVLLFANLGKDGWSFSGFTVNGNFGGMDEENIATEKMALESIEDAEWTREDMFENNFSIAFVDDILLKMKREFETVEYAEILKNSSSSTEDVRRAREILLLVDWRKISYADILVYGYEIEDRRRHAFDIYDLLVVSEIKIKNYEARGVNVSGAWEALDKAEEVFYDDRYKDAQILIEDVRDILEMELVKSTRMNVLKRSTKNFFQKNWLYIILSLSLLGVISFFLRRKISKDILRKKIDSMKLEKKSLFELMKKVQVERYGDCEMPNAIYDIKMKRYQERMGEIKELLPVLEERLSKHASVNE